MAKSYLGFRFTRRARVKAIRAVRRIYSGIEDMILRPIRFDF